MRKILGMFLTVAICVIAGCYSPWGDDPPISGQLEQQKMMQVAVELRGPHYAKLNSIACLQYNDMEVVRRHNDFDTIDNLIREKRCFVIPTDTDIFINERVSGDIVSARLKDSTRSFYTVRSNLVAK
jgi:hypothetical protein